MLAVTLCYTDTITHILPASTSYNSKIAPLLVYCFLRYKEIVLAGNGLLWILNKSRSFLLKNCSENLNFAKLKIKF